MDFDRESYINNANQLKQQQQHIHCSCRDSFKLCCSHCFELYPEPSLQTRVLRTWESMPLLLCPKCMKVYNESSSFTGLY